MLIEDNRPPDRRWWAGLVWDSEGYGTALLDESGTVVARERFDRCGPEAPAAWLARWAARVHGGLVTVFESSNGVMDGLLLVGGLHVLRVDLRHLPRTDADAAVLADAARRGLVPTVPVGLAGGTLGDRSDEMRRANASVATLQDELNRSGRLVTTCPGAPAGPPRVALTFDDGPSPLHTDRVLRILKSFGVPAAFFCVGLQVRARPDLVRRMVDEGHEVGNHTWSHAYLPELGEDETVRQLRTTSRVIAEATGVPPVLARPPYGGRGGTVLRATADEGLTTVLWDVEASDWTLPGADAIADSVLRQARDGSVVLLHDGGGERDQTVAALPRIIGGLLDRGFQFSGIAGPAGLLPPAAAQPAAGAPHSVTRERDHAPLRHR
ncbi:polysaccharide deacetylase family protein [Streptomyces sp. NBC_00525]|uniref:polysaccharide deacetylase family protein n=1 Tax=Streptomyces sp. NBC_00525 TaxID=2903660 RepID=UPI002E81F9C9|nr:polysaccharide deacetylase family protein [Streptomyces sp. NBC_00525]WUC96295.1 polysaccharide deacetylase family protein [Streptomyces sp. NBC_00525]